MNMENQLDLYKDCIARQLEEVDMLSSIYCTPGEMHIFDPGVISDFNEFLQKPSKESVGVLLKSQLDYNVKLELQDTKNKLDVRIELPHLYPALENALVIVHSPLLNKNKESYLKEEIEKFINTIDKSDTYIFQVLSWLQEEIEVLLRKDASELKKNDMNAQTNTEPELVEFERLWIYSHHIKSKTKRQEIVRQSRNLDLSGFSRPGKPGIICVEGLKECTQEFWRIIKSMHWQKISICKTESSRNPRKDLDKLRKFADFKELLFCDDMENEEGVMNMRLFLKYLESHDSSFMKKELFGLE